MVLDYKAFSIPFQHPFTISKGTKTHQPTLVVQLSHLGLKGLGEAPAIAYYNVTTELLEQVCKAKKTFIEKFAFTEPERYWHYLHHLLPMHPFLVCALDMAGWDLYGKMKRKKCFELFGGNIANHPITDYTIGIDTIEKMVEKMQEKPWPIYKIKLGTDRDIEIVESLRKHTDAILRIDANAAWTADEALKKINVFTQLGVEFIEQPLAKDDWAGMEKLFAESPIPLYADESCVFENDVEKCLNHFHGINIKLTKCSGITPALRMIENAKKSNLKIMLGSMNESTIGSSAIAHLLPLVDHVDMDGPLLLAADLATGFTFNNDGSINYSEGYGLGVQLIGPLGQ